MSGAAGGFSSLLTRWVSGVLRWRKSVIVAGLAAGFFSLQYAAGTLGINTDTANMISADLEWRQDFIEYRDNFPIRDRNLIVVVDAPTAERAADFAAALAAVLRGESERFESVFLAGDDEFFKRNGLLYLSVPQLIALGDRLVAAQPLLGLLQTRFNGAGVIEVANETAVASADHDIRSELGIFYQELADVLNATATGERRRLDWAGLIREGETESTRQIVLLQPKLDFSRIQPAGEAITRVRAVVEELKLEHGADVRARITGTVAMEHEELVSVSRDASLAGLASLALVAIVLYWSVRSLRLLLASLATLLVGLAGTAAFAAATVGHLNLISVAFAVLYVGLGVDFILHICLRFNELRGKGHDAGVSVVETTRGVGASLVICAVTTAAGFFAFIPTSFEGVSELGLISGGGMFISLLVSLTFLPALLATLAPVSVPQRPDSRVRIAIARALARHNRRVLACLAVVAVTTLLTLPLVSFDSNPIHLRDPASESVITIEELAADSAAPLLSMVALADDRQTALRWAAELETLAAVREVQSIDGLVPNQQEEKQFLLEDIALALGPNFERLAPLAPDTVGLHAALRTLGDSLKSAQVVAPLQRAIDAVLARIAAAPAPDVLLNGLDTDLRSDLPAELERLATGLAARPFGRDDLPAELTARWVSPDGHQLIEIVPRDNINDNSAAGRFVDAVRAAVPSATGLPVVYREASATVVNSFRLALLYASIMVVGLLFVFLRRKQDVLLVMIPIVFAMGVTAGVTVLLGMPFNFANIIALPLLVGVGVDNGIHMVHRMRTEPPADGDALHTSTSRAVVASGLTTIASFGNLAYSSHLGMASMGKLLTLGMVVTMVATLVLLPALLRLRTKL